MVDLEAWPEWNSRSVSATLNGSLEPGTKISFGPIGRGERAFHTSPRLVAVTQREELAWEANGLGLRVPRQPASRRTTTEEP